MAAHAKERPVDLNRGPSPRLKWGTFTLAALQREERLKLEAYRATQFEAGPKVNVVELAESWTPELASVAIRMHKVSGLTQTEFAQLHGFPVSRFRSKVAREVRASL